jgi:DHA3 family tetracycline resistance protein-like MFS transporter
LKKLNAYRVYLVIQGAWAFFFNLIVTVNIVYQVVTVGLNPLQLVLVGTALELSAAVFEVPTGVVADVYGRRLSVTIGMTLTGIGFMVEGSLPVWGMVMLGQAIWGLGWTFISGALEAWIADEIGTERAGEAYLRGSQVGHVMGLAAILPSVLLASVAVNLPIVLGGALFVALGLFLVLFMPEEGFRPAPRHERDSWRQMRDTLRQGIGLVRLRPVLLGLLAIELFYGAYSEGFDRLWTAFLLEYHSLPAVGQLDPVVWFGVIRAVGSLLTIGSTEVVRRRLNLTSQRSVTTSMLFLYGVVGAGTIAYGLSRGFIFALAAYWIVVVARSTASPVFTAWLNQHVDSRVRATVLSMSAQANEVGQVAGGPAVGFVGTVVSLRAALTVSGMLLAPALLLLRGQRSAARRDDQVAGV